MRRQVDHHLARARAIGRRASAQARADRVGEPRSGPARGRPALREVSPSTSPATTRRRSGSSGRTSTKCSATSSRMPRNMAAAACSSPSSRRAEGRHPGRGRRPRHSRGTARRAVHPRRAARHDGQARHRPRPRHRPRRRRDLRRHRSTLEESEDLGGLLARLTPARGLGIAERPFVEKSVALGALQAYVAPSEFRVGDYYP